MRIWINPVGLESRKGHKIRNKVAVAAIESNPPKHPTILLNLVDHRSPRSSLRSETNWGGGMMNFTPNRGSSLEDDDRGKLPFSQYYSSSPSSSSSHHKGMLPLTYQEACPGNDFELASTQEETTARYSYKSGANLELKDSPGNEGCRRAGSAGVAAAAEEREHMFDKVVTPSDVGKLNRLVIPKQHAEKYFPLDSSANEKGLLLNFEDRSGKPWRFRYSYWNSSQSYVMTKGWSRFVKDKKLDAGDIVSFQRGVGEAGKDLLYIDWRRRPEATELAPSALHPLSLPHHISFQYPWSGSAPLYLQPQGDHRRHHHHHHHRHHHQYPGLFPRAYAAGSSYQHLETGVVGPCGYMNRAAPVIYVRSAAKAPAPQAMGMVEMQRGGGGGGGWSGVGGAEAMVFESVPVVQGKAAAKRLRLFGVNMECPISESDECDVLSSATTPHATMATRHHPHQLTSSSDAAALPLLPLQSSLYNATPLPKMPSDLLHKDKASMSLDFDI